MGFNLLESIDDLEPVYSKATRGAIGNAFCANWQTISGFWRGRFGVAGAWPAYIQAFKECGADFGSGSSGGSGAGIDFVPGPPFVGGQCDTLYLVSYTWELENSGSFSGANTYAGPINGSVFEPADDVPGSGAQYGRGGINFGDPSSVAYVVFGSISEDVVAFQIDSVSRVDGMPDDCGDLPGDNPNFPPVIPNPGPPPSDPEADPILVPSVGDVDIDIVFEGDTYNFDFDVGDITIKDNGDLNIDIDGRSWGLTPGLDVISPDDIVGDVVDTLLPDIDAQVLFLQAQVEALRLQLQCVIADSCGFDQYLIEVPVCGGGTVPLQTGGIGTNKVIDVFIDTILAVNSNILAICDAVPEPTPDAPREALYSQVVIADNEAGSPNPLNDDVFYVDVEFTKIADGNKVYKVGVDGERQGRFGYLIQGFLLGNERLWGEPQPLWFEKNRIKIDRSYDGQIYIRVSSHVGNEFSVYDSGIRL